MSTIAQTLYLSTGAKDFTAAGEVDIRKLVAVAGASDSTSITSHPNAAGTTSITLDPYTTTTLQSDIRANLGWAINQAGTDGMASSSTVPRFIPAGAWTFTLGVTVPVGATGTGALSVTYVAAVYRVSSTGSRTLLFTATSAAVASSSAVAGTGYPVATSAAQPEYALAPSESIEVGYLTTCVQTAGLLSATVAGNITWAMGDAQAYVQVPAPGIRTRYASVLSDNAPASDATARQMSSMRTLSEATSMSDAVARRASCSRNTADTAPATEAVTRVYLSARLLADTGPASDALARLFTANRSLPDSVAVSEVLTRRYTGNRAVTDAAPATEAVVRQLIYARGMLDAMSSSSSTVNNYVRPMLIFEG